MFVGKLGKLFIPLTRQLTEPIIPGDLTVLFIKEMPKYSFKSEPLFIEGIDF